MDNGDLEELTEWLLGIDLNGEGSIVGVLVTPGIILSSDDTEVGGDVLDGVSVSVVVVQLDGEGLTVLDTGDLDVVVTVLGVAVVVDVLHEEDTGGGGTVVDAFEGGVPAGGVVEVSIGILGLVEEDNEVDVDIDENDYSGANQMDREQTDDATATGMLLSNRPHSADQEGGSPRWIQKHKRRRQILIQQLVGCHHP